MPVGTDQMDVDIDLGRLLAAVWRRKVAIGVITLCAAIAAFLVTSLMSPLYRSETRLLIEPRVPVYTSEQGQRPLQTAFDERTITSQVEILKSADLIKKVALELDLATREEFDPAANPSLLTRILVGFGVAKNPLDVPPGERVLDAFYEKLEVYAVASSRIVAIRFSSQDPELAAAVPKALANAYLRFNAGFKLEDNSDASAWLGQEIERLRVTVREAEEKVAGYRAEKGLLLVGENETITARQMADISTELSRVRAERADAEARARSVRAALDAGQDVGTLSDVLQSPAVQRLREREGEIRAEIADLSITLLDGHPRMKALRAQLGDIEGRMVAATRDVLESLENNARLAALREEELSGQLAALKSGSAREGEEAVQLRSLEREAASQRELLETYLARYRESASRSEPQSTPADARIISGAVPAGDPYFPKTMPIVMVTALAALILSSIWVMLGELFSGRALRPAEGASGNVVGSATDIVAGNGTVDSEMNEAAEREVASLAATSELTAQTDHPVSVSRVAALSGLANQQADFSVEAVAEQLLGEETALAICVSPEGDEGSASAVMLARTVAGEGARTLLIDLTGSGCPTDLMAEMPGLSGLTNLLCGEVTIGEAIHADRLSRAQIIPNGTANARRAMRAIDRLPMLLDALADAYDLVVVECGAADAQAISRIARKPGTEIILSLVHPDEDEITTTLGKFLEEGFENVMLMSPASMPGGPGEDRAAA